MRFGGGGRLCLLRGCELCHAPCGRGLSVTEACLSGGRGLCLVVAVDRVQERGVPVEEGRLVGMEMPSGCTVGPTCCDLGAHGSQASC